MKLLLNKESNFLAVVWEGEDEIELFKHMCNGWASRAIPMKAPYRDNCVCQPLVRQIADEFNKQSKEK